MNISVKSFTNISNKTICLVQEIIIIYCPRNVKEITKSQISLALQTERKLETLQVNVLYHLMHAPSVLIICISKFYAIMDNFSGILWLLRGVQKKAFHHIPTISNPKSYHKLQRKSYILKQ